MLFPLRSCMKFISKGRKDFEVISILTNRPLCKTNCGKQRLVKGPQQARTLFVYPFFSFSMSPVLKEISTSLPNDSFFLFVLCTALQRKQSFLLMSFCKAVKKEVNNAVSATRVCGWPKSMEICYEAPAPSTHMDTAKNQSVYRI